MKHLVCHFLFILLFFVSANALAQAGYTISGTITDENHQLVKGATVFISGTQQITATNTDGQFILSRIAAGNYVLSVKMLGYATASQDVTVHDKPINLTITLTVKSIVLKEVKIGSDKEWAKHYALFKDQFLGTSANAKNCVILNPEIVNFSTQKTGDIKLFKIDGGIVLKADADDFLVIENHQLGYRIKYLLKTFEHNTATLHTFYDGDYSFAELDGTDEQKKVWAQNRLTAYKGSMMHFLRSVYAKTVLDQGFITKQMLKSKNSWDKQTYISPSLVKFDTLVTTVDTSFISFKFRALYIDYNPKKAARLKLGEITKDEKQEEANSNLFGKSNNPDNSLIVTPAGTSSQLLLYLKEAIIDAKGSVFTGYLRTFLIRGIWADKRIGDQLPFEYQPSKTDN